MNIAPRLARLPLLTLLLLLIAPPRADAQYLYLDLNGDSLNTAADILNPLQLANVDVYLRTDRNRDGSPAGCDSGQTLAIGSVEFILHATVGTVTWGALSPGTLFGGAVRTAQNATDFYAGFFDSTDAFVPPGRYRVGRLSVVAGLTAPFLGFASSTPLSGSYLTSFGSPCRGQDADHTMKLGRDWHDADGTFSSSLSTVGGTVFKDVNGTSSGNCALDAGEPGMPGWQVTLSPSGQTVLTSHGGAYEFRNVLPGVYSVHLSSPAAWNQTCPGGGGSQAVVVLAGQTYPNLNFGVRPSNLSPGLSPIPPRTSAVGLVTNQPLTATDPDNASVSFSLVRGPSFASVTTTGPKSGNLRLAPQSGDVGTYQVTVAVTDGLFGAQQSASVNVLSATAVEESSAPGRLVASILPNPLNPMGKLVFTTAHAGVVRAALYDVRGRMVRQLTDGRVLPAGRHEIPIDGRDDAGRPLASGVYLYQLDTSQGSRVGRAVVLK